MVDSNSVFISISKPGTKAQDKSTATGTDDGTPKRCCTENYTISVSGLNRIGTYKLDENKT